jgi:lysozyme
MSLFTDIKALFEPAAGRMVALAETIAQHEELKAGAVALATPEELQLTSTCIPLIERDEGDVLHAYPDPGTGGAPWTIGYGHTGADVTPGLVIMQFQADALLASDLQRFEDGVTSDLNGGVISTSSAEFSAMVSLAYNIGLGNYAKSSVLRFHKLGQFQQAADAFLLWDRAAGNVLPGLVRRRHQEREMYLGLAIDQ